MITAIGDVMRESYARGWITTRDGNCSLRKRGNDFIHITPSGWRKNVIYPELMLKLQMDSEGNAIVPEGARPSGELHMHMLLLRNATKTRAVVHLHPTHVVAAVFRGFDLQKLAGAFPEIFRYTRVGPSVPVLPATSKELGDATARALGLGEGHSGAPASLKYDIVAQGNHGVCSVAGDPWTAFEHIERLNHICEIVLASGVTPESFAAGN